jgi:hypothetical protein
MTNTTNEVATLAQALSRIMWLSCGRAFVSLLQVTDILTL